MYVLKGEETCGYGCVGGDGKSGVYRCGRVWQKVAWEEGVSWLEGVRGEDVIKVKVWWSAEGVTGMRGVVEELEGVDCKKKTQIDK